jgi:hypothetical protein
MECSLNKTDCPPYIPKRDYEDIEDLPNPFITSHQTEKQNREIIYKIPKCNKKSKDELFFVLCFLVFVLIAKLFYK